MSSVKAKTLIIDGDTRKNDPVTVWGTFLDDDETHYDGYDYVSEYTPRGFRATPSDKHPPLDISQNPDAFDAVGELLYSTLMQIQLDFMRLTCGIHPELIIYEFLFKDYPNRETGHVFGCFPISGSMRDSVATHLQDPEANSLYYAKILRGRN